MRPALALARGMALPSAWRGLPSLWRMLDLPRLVFIVLGICLLFLVPLFDTDYYWHLAAGEWIVRHGALPQGDPFSWSRHGQPWVLHEWLFEVTLYAADSVAGNFGVKLLAAALVTFATVLGYRTALRLTGNTTLALALAILGLAALLPWCSPRPHLVSYVLFAFVLQRLVAFKYAGDLSGCWLLPPAMVLWVNCHGGYAAGLFLMALFCVCEWSRVAAWRTDPVRRRGLLKLSGLVLISALATSINPEFVRHWLYPFQVLNMDYANALIAEWQSPSFHTRLGRLYLLLVFGFCVASIYRRTRPDLTELSVPAAFIALGFVSARHAPLAGVAMLPFCASALRDGAASRVLARLRGAGRPLGGIEFAINWTVLTLIVAVAWRVYPAHSALEAAHLDEVLPVRAAQFIRRNGIEGRLFNAYGDGGYLIHALYPRQRVFVDGRADLYGDAFLKDYMRMYAGGAGWDAGFDAQRFDLVLTGNDAPLCQLLLLRGDFGVIYRDRQFTLMARRGPRYTRLLEVEDGHAT